MSYASQTFCATRTVLVFTKVEDLVKSTTNWVHNCLNRDDKPAKRIDATLDDLHIDVWKNSDGTASITIAGRTAMSSYRSRLYRGSLSNEFNIKQVALDLMKSESTAKRFAGHAIACSLLGTDPEQF